MRLSLQRKDPIRVEPYEKLSEIYDYVMRHVDYNLWGGYIHDLIKAWHPQANHILDVGCGTGNLLQELSRYDYHLCGCDQSLTMLRRAQEKRALARVPMWCSSMIDFALRRKADIILCSYDSLNYILEPEKVVTFITTAARGLNPGGLLIFDICTERNSVKHFLNYHDHAHHADFSYDRWSHYDSDQKIQYTEFKLKFKEDPNVYVETHRQKIYSIRKLNALIEATPLKIMEAYDEFTFNPATSKSNRLHFLLQLKELMLSFNNVSYHYSGGYGISDVTYSIQNGEFVFLVGPSGAGKSTIFKLINLEHMPSRGHIILDSLNTAHVHRREIPFLRRKVGFIFQDFKLLRDRNVYDNIAFAMHAVGARRRIIKRRVLEVLKDVGLTHKRLKNPLELSGGEQQRVAIARALINAPYILLADEPTGNLDDDTAFEILELLARINSQGTAVFMATHKQDLADQLAKRTINIRNGRIEQ